MKRLIIFLFTVSCLLSFVSAEVVFSGLDLSGQDMLAYRARADFPGYGEYDTLFISNLQKKTMDQLTFFPENVMFLRDKGFLQIQNRFGVARSDGNFNSMASISTLPSFVRGDQIKTGKINPIQASPDGNFLLYLAPTSFAFADLVLIDLAKNKELVVSRKVELSLNEPPVRWSKDAKFFIYEKNNALYYYSLDQYKENRVLSEEYRPIGPGKISCVSWGAKNALYYIAGDLVYRVMSVEFFTRSLYQGLLPIGSVAGKLSFEFDHNFDRFWISPDDQYILVNKGGRNIFLYFLGTDDFSSKGDIRSLPYLYLPRNTNISNVLWSLDGTITLLAESIDKGANTSSIFRVKLDASSLANTFIKTDDTGVFSIELSPDERNAVLLKKDKVVVKNYKTWRDEITFLHPQPIRSIWKDEDEVFVCGAWYSELRNIYGGSGKIICLSQPEKYGFSQDESLMVQVQGRNYSYLPEKQQWQSIGAFSVLQPRVASNSFRVYLEPLSTGSYRNMVMVRNIKGFGTDPLFDYPKQLYEPFPEQEEPVDFLNFTHGSRIRRREVALVFNAVDSVEGLTPVLSTLAEYGIRATFFVNGEFIRRHPGAVREIADSGHEVGSLFYTYFNMTDARFKVDREFIKGGLARNEDDYFAVTGKEVSLLWHAPFYFVNSDIIEVSREMNYAYIGRDVDALDWVPKVEKSGTSAVYMNSADLVERVMVLKKPGSIVPINFGRPAGGRDDYFYQKLDILINGLLALGYKVVPVSALMEHAK